MGIQILVFSFLFSPAFAAVPQSCPDVVSPREKIVAAITRAEPKVESGFALEALATYLETPLDLQDLNRPVTAGETREAGLGADELTRHYRELAENVRRLNEIIGGNPALKAIRLKNIGSTLRQALNSSLAQSARQQFAADADAERYAATMRKMLAAVFKTYGDHVEDFIQSLAGQ